MYQIVEASHRPLLELDPLHQIVKETYRAAGQAAMQFWPPSKNVCKKKTMSEMGDAVAIEDEC